MYFCIRMWIFLNSMNIKKKIWTALMGTESLSKKKNMQTN